MTWLLPEAKRRGRLQKDDNAPRSVCVSPAGNKRTGIVGHIGVVFGGSSGER